MLFKIDEWIICPLKYTNEYWYPFENIYKKFHYNSKQEWFGDSFMSFYKSLIKSSIQIEILYESFLFGDSSNIE